MNWQLKQPFLVREGLEMGTSYIFLAFPVTSLPCPLIELAGIASLGKELGSKTNCSCGGWQLEQSRLGTRSETHVPCREGDREEGGGGSCLPGTTTGSDLGLLALDKRTELRAASPLSSDWIFGMSLKHTPCSSCVTQCFHSLSENSACFSVHSA